ncbi:MAG: PepSY-like domain-containing protein, partial [Planctomycetota bacterium]
MRTGLSKVAGIIALATVVIAASQTAYAEEIALPAPAANAVKAAFPGATVSEIERENENGVLLYEVELKQNGAEIDVKVMADGTIVEVESKIAAKDLPAAVAKAVEKAAPGATIKEVERKEIRAALKAGKVVKLAKPEVVYEVEVVKDGKE